MGIWAVPAFSRSGRIPRCPIKKYIFWIGDSAYPRHRTIRAEILIRYRGGFPLWIMTVIPYILGLSGSPVSRFSPGRHGNGFPKQGAGQCRIFICPMPGIKTVGTGQAGAKNKWGIRPGNLIKHLWSFCGPCKGHRLIR